MEASNSITLFEGNSVGTASRLAVLLVDDNPDSMRPFAILLQNRGYTVVCADSYDSALEGFDLLSGCLVATVVDINLGEPGRNGLNLIDHFNEVSPNRVVALVLTGLTGHNLEIYKMTAYMAGASSFEVKPISPTLLLSWLEGKMVKNRFSGLHDGLTKDLLNYESFKELATNRIETMLTRNWPRVLTLILMDCNGLKATNDTYGHLVGDELLRQFGKTISDNIRPSDMSCRRSGDEFLVLLHDVGMEEALTKSQAILEASKAIEVLTPAGDTARISFSYGISEARCDSSEGDVVSVYESMEETADARMMEMKQQSRSSR